MKKLVLTLCALACAVALAAPVFAGDKPEKKERKACSCGCTTVEKGAKCDKCACCKKAAEKGKVCAKCNPKKEKEEKK